MAKKPKQTILAVAYCRKSTNPKTAAEAKRQAEKSIEDQTARIKKLKPPDEGADYEIVRWYVKDKGVPGWKRGASRPDYFKLVNELKETKAKAILVDDMDRFSRADEYEVMSDVQQLREHHGIRLIHACNQGCVNLVTDQFGAMKIAMSAMASHEFSTRLSRRIANARLDAAKKGLRSGGQAPYGLANDGKGGLKPGNPKEVRWVRWIFDQFVKHLKSMNWIAAELNRQKVQTSQGKVPTPDHPGWYVKTVQELLKRREYAGHFSYNAKKSGTFHIVNAEYEVEAVHPNYQDDEEKNHPWAVTDEGRIIKAGVFKPLVDPKLFDAAQERLAGFSIKGSRRPREGGYPLSRILICDHCGKPLYGCTARGVRVYRCSTNGKCGMGSCGCYEVREQPILDFVLRLLGQEIERLGQRLETPKCPIELRPAQDHQADLEQQLADVKAKIDKAAENLMLADDRTRPIIDGKLKALWADHDRLAAELNATPADAEEREYETLRSILAWWRTTGRKQLVKVPVPGNDGKHVKASHRAVNEALHSLGCEVRLRWKTEKITLPSGTCQNRHKLDRGRFRLGQVQGEIRERRGQNGVMFCISRFAAACNGSSAARRRGSRRGTG